MLAGLCAFYKRARVGTIVLIASLILDSLRCFMYDGQSSAEALTADVLCFLGNEGSPVIADRHRSTTANLPLGVVMSARTENGSVRVVPSRRFRLRQKDWLPYAMIAPAVLVVLGIAIYPAFTAVQISLMEMNLLRLAQAKFVGLANFQKLFLLDDVFAQSVWGTLRWTGVIVAGQMALGLPVALFLNLHFRWRGFARTVILTPWVVSPAVTAIIWIYLFDANFGVINEILVRLRILPAYFAWISDSNGSFFILVMAMIWTGFPFMAIMLLAALQALPEDVYEAARIDGAGFWQSFRFVTFPQLLPTILLLFLLRSMWLSHHVDVIFLVTGGGPGIANYTLPVYSFKLTSIQMNVGYASAVAVVLALILLLAAIVYTRYIEKTREYLA